MTRVVVGLKEVVAGYKEQKARIVAHLREATARRAATERELGEHWRAKVWNHEPEPTELAHRESLSGRLRGVLLEIERLKSEWNALDKAQHQAVRAEEVVAAKERRRVISVEAGFARAELVKAAVFASDGLDRAGLRPCAWWFPIVSPDGKWFEETASRATYCLEELD